MAQSATPRIRISAESQQALKKLANLILQNHAQQTDFVNKLTQIDIAYARYKQKQQNMSNGEDIDSNATECGLNLDDITVPVVVSQVDAYVGYLADIYLSGYPIFPVVSPPAFRQEAEALQSIIDDHAVRGRYVRQLLMNFYDAVKYNLTVAEQE